MERGEENVLPVTPRVDTVMRTIMMGRMTPFIQWAASPQRRPRTSDKTRREFLLRSWFLSRSIHIGKFRQPIIVVQIRFSPQRRKGIRFFSCRQEERQEKR